MEYKIHQALAKEIDVSRSKSLFGSFYWFYLYIRKKNKEYCQLRGTAPQIAIRANLRCWGRSIGARWACQTLPETLVAQETEKEVVSCSHLSWDDRSEWIIDRNSYASHSNVSVVFSRYFSVVSVCCRLHWQQRVPTQFPVDLSDHIWHLSANN